MGRRWPMPVDDLPLSVGHRTCAEQPVRHGRLPYRSGAASGQPTLSTLALFRTTAAPRRRMGLAPRHEPVLRSLPTPWAERRVWFQAGVEVDTARRSLRALTDPQSYRFGRWQVRYWRWTDDSLDPAVGAARRGIVGCLLHGGWAGPVPVGRLPAAALVVGGGVLVLERVGGTGRSGTLVRTLSLQRRSSRWRCRGCRASAAELLHPSSQGVAVDEGPRSRPRAPAVGHSCVPQGVQGPCRRWRRRDAVGCDAATPTSASTASTSVHRRPRAAQSASCCPVAVRRRSMAARCRTARTCTTSRRFRSEFALSLRGTPASPGIPMRTCLGSQPTGLDPAGTATDRRMLPAAVAERLRSAVATRRLISAEDEGARRSSGRPDRRRAYLSAPRRVRRGQPRRLRASCSPVVAYVGDLTRPTGRRRTDACLPSSARFRPWRASAALAGRISIPGLREQLEALGRLGIAPSTWAAPTGPGPPTSPPGPCRPGSAALHRKYAEGAVPVEKLFEVLLAAGRPWLRVLSPSSAASWKRPGAGLLVDPWTWTLSRRHRSPLARPGARVPWASRGRAAGARRVLLDVGGATPPSLYEGLEPR